MAAGREALPFLGGEVAHPVISQPPMSRTLIPNCMLAGIEEDTNGRNKRNLPEETRWVLLRR